MANDSVAIEVARDAQRSRRAPGGRRPKGGGGFRRIVILTLVAGAVATIAVARVRGAGAGDPRTDRSTTLVPASGVLLGAQVATGFARATQRALGGLEARAGRRFDVVYQQLRWDESLGRTAALQHDGQGRIPLLGWTPTRSDGSIVPWPSIAQGSEDARLAAVATSLKERNGKLFLAFAYHPEPHVGGAFGSAADYVRAYRHVHDVFARLGAANVVWVWSMSGAPRWSSLHNRLYPGDGYADWLAFDMGDAGCGGRSRSLADLTRPLHHWVATRHPDKPVMTTGYGATRHPAAAAEPDRLATDLSAVAVRRPEIKAVVYAGAGSPGRCRQAGDSSSLPATPLAPAGPAGRPGNRSTAASAQACLSRSGATVTSVDGTLQTYRVGSVTDNHTYDLRRATIVGYPTTNRYPLLFGKQGPGDATCVVGGRLAGQQSRALSWQAMKQRLDGDGLNFRSQGGIVDGIRIDNVEDGISTTGGDPQGVTIRNAYLTHIRDDCIENDAIVGLTVYDSLLDGCFNGVSERPGRGASSPPPSPDEALTLDGVLIRLRPMPYDRTRALCQRNATDGLGSSGFFKWSSSANRLVVRNTVLLAERDSVNCGASMRLPGGVYENVTLVWLGGGDYPGGPLPGGITMTRERRTWEEARVSWLTRHGYPVTGDVVAP